MWLADVIWNTFIAPWPDVEAGKIEVRDIANIAVGFLSLVVGCLGTWLAHLSIKRGREQDAVTQRQIDLAVEQKTLLNELGKLEAKQAAFAEIQLSMLEREQSKKAVLKLALPTPPATNLTGPTTYQLFLLNDGDKAEGGYWYLGIPKRMRGRVEFLPSLGNEEVLVPADNWHIAGAFDQPLVSCFSDDFFLVKFKVAIPVEPGAMAPCAKISVVWQDEVRDQSQRVFLWFTKGPSGRFPERGMKKLRLYSVSDAVFKAQYGGQVLPPDDPDDMA